MAVHMTVYHDGGKDVTTYPPFKDWREAYAKLDEIRTNGCWIKKEVMTFYPPWRIWRVEFKEA